MPTTLTTNYNMQKPEVGADTDQWGYMLNADLDTIDRELFDSVKKTTGGTPQQMTNVLLTAECPQIPAGGAEMWFNRVATISWVEWRIKTFLNQAVPHATIMLWAGDFNNIPAGWVRCDGLNGTPNLLGRFVLCASPSIAGILPGQGAGTPTGQPGYHTHYDSGATTNLGAGQGFVSNADSSAPIYRAPGSPASGPSVVPYAAVVYIMKYGSWV